MAVGGGLALYHVLGVASFVALLYFTLFGKMDPRDISLPSLPASGFGSSSRAAAAVMAAPFVERRGAQLFLDGQPFYPNGWNSYWLMDQAVEPRSRDRVSRMFRAAAEMGLTVCRTWAFNDGAYNALQVSPGHFDERVFKALDRVVVEAGRHGVRLILSLANNLEAYGGKTQYVRWAWEEGVGLSASNDSFFFDPAIRDYFKVYLKTLLTRKNHLTGVEYRDDPTILAWELMNEPRCTTDPSGDTLQRWIEEMGAYVKSIDKKHLLTVGTEGFYGPTSSERKRDVNPGVWKDNNYGSDFIRNAKIPDIDFASIHLYPDTWLQKQHATVDEKLQFVKRWVSSHIEDGDKELDKPVLTTEFGLSRRAQGFDPAHRDLFYKAIYDIVYASASRGGAGAAAFVWQLAPEGMEEYHPSPIFPHTGGGAPGSEGRRRAALLPPSAERQGRRRRGGGARDSRRPPSRGRRLHGSDEARPPHPRPRAPRRGPTSTYLARWRLPSPARAPPLSPWCGPCFFPATPSFSLPLSHGGTHRAVERPVRRGLCHSPSKRARDGGRGTEQDGSVPFPGRRCGGGGSFPGPFQAPGADGLMVW